jgi:hypothetical protein
MARGEVIICRCPRLTSLLLSCTIYSVRWNRSWPDPGRWLKTPHDQLGGRQPLDLIGTKDEQQLRDLIPHRLPGPPRRPVPQVSAYDASVAWSRSTLPAAS